MEVDILIDGFTDCLVERGTGKQVARGQRMYINEAAADILIEQYIRKRVVVC